MSISFILWYVLQFFPLVVVQIIHGPPNYNVYNPPATSFTCEGKVVGGYYADPEAFCQLFHICVQIDETQVQDFRFLCPNDTLFDQENFVCADWRDVNCSKAILYYDKNLELFKPTEDEVDRAQQQFEIESAQEPVLERRKRQMFEAPISENEDLAKTNFSCENRTTGGYYADMEVECQVFHICVNLGDGQWLDKKFKCLNGTIFDQEKLFCRPKEKVACVEGTSFYNSTVSLHLAIMRKQLESPTDNVTKTIVNITTALHNNDSSTPCCVSSNNTDIDEDEENFTYFNYNETKVFDGTNNVTTTFNLTNDFNDQVFNLSSLVTLDGIDDDEEEEEEEENEKETI